VGGTNVQQMIAAAISGDRIALESLLLRHHDPLLRYLKSLLARKGVTTVDAEDVLQETLVEAFRRIETLESRGEEAFAAWLKLVARTRLSNMLKGHRAAKRGGGKRRIVAVANSPGAQTVTTILGLLSSSTPTPSLILRRKEAGKALQDALSALLPLKQQIMGWRYGQGMSIESIAAKTGKSVSAVKMIIHRCLQDLRLDLEKNGELTHGV
jgi:RNA polymerase sigma-70 factor (ECF subfamily)